MRWIGSRIPGWGLLGRKAAAEPQEGPQAAEEASPARASSRLLVLLVPDALAPTARRLHTFGDVKSAAEFVRIFFPPLHRHSIIAFWALQRRAADSRGQAVALTRDAIEPEVVYALSFDEMEAAQAFLRAEALAGTRLERMIAYWATPVRIETDAWGNVQLVPGEPPSPALALAADDASDAIPPEELLDEEVSGALGEAERLLRAGRRDGPFRGFGSPPGRF
jgi:hypothetical protein